MKKALFLIGIIFCFFGCKKDDTAIVFSLPSKTQSGQNTFGFIRDSLVWTNFGQVCFPFSSGCRDNLKGYYYLNGDLAINADRVIFKNGSWNTSETININLKTNFRGTNTYNTLTNDEIGVFYTSSEIYKDQRVYVTSLIKPKFIITLTKIDTINKIISGDFSGVLFKKAQDTTNAISTLDSIVIKDGRFDIKIK